MIRWLIVGYLSYFGIVILVCAPVLYVLWRRTDPARERRPNLKPVSAEDGGP